MRTPLLALALMLAGCTAPEEPVEPAASPTAGPPAEAAATAASAPAAAPPKPHRVPLQGVTNGAVGVLEERLFVYNAETSFRAPEAASLLIVLNWTGHAPVGIEIALMHADSAYYRATATESPFTLELPPGDFPTGTTNVLVQAPAPGIVADVRYEGYALLTVSETS